jgi:hypothetical protein
MHIVVDNLWVSVNSTYTISLRLNQYLSEITPYFSGFHFRMVKLVDLSLVSGCLH